MEGDLTRSHPWLVLTIVGALVAGCQPTPRVVPPTPPPVLVPPPVPADPRTPVPPSRVPPSDAALIQASDLTNGGAFRIPASGADGSFSVGGMAIRYVNGERHFLLYQNHAAGTITQVAAASSASVFTVQTGAAARLAVGEWVNINRAAAAPGSLPEQGQITAIVGDTLTISPAFGATPRAGDQVWYWSDVVYELVDPTAASCHTGAYNADYTVAPRACLYAIWTNLYGDGHHSVRMSWSGSGVPDNPNGILPAGLYWNQAQGALYFAWLQQYASSNVAASLGFATLDSVSGTVGTSTPHGPWRPTYTDGDGITQRGAKACEFFSVNPGDGSMLCTSWGVGQIDASTSWGPDVRWGLTFPRASTPSGFRAADLSLNHTGANYYCMIQGDCQRSTNYVTANGSLVGHLRSARHPVGWAQIFEDFSQDNTGYVNARIDPATNGGVSSWDGSDSVTGVVRISDARREIGRHLVWGPIGFRRQRSDQLQQRARLVRKRGHRVHQDLRAQGYVPERRDGDGARRLLGRRHPLELAHCECVGPHGHHRHGICGRHSHRGAVRGLRVPASNFTTHGKCTHLCTCRD